MRGIAAILALLCTPWSAWPALGPEDSAKLLAASATAGLIEDAHWNYLRIRKKTENLKHKLSADIFEGRLYQREIILRDSSGAKSEALLLNGSVAYQVTLPPLILPGQDEHRLVFLYIDPQNLSEHVQADQEALEREIQKLRIHKKQHVVLMEYSPHSQEPIGVSSFAFRSHDWYRTSDGWKDYLTSIREKMSAGDTLISVGSVGLDTSIILGLSMLASNSGSFDSNPAFFSAAVSLGLMHWDNTWRNYLNASASTLIRRTKSFARSSSFRYLIHLSAFGGGSLLLTDVDGGLNHAFIALNAYISSQIGDRLFRIGATEQTLLLKEGSITIGSIKLRKQILSYTLWSKLGFLAVVPDILKLGPKVQLYEGVDVAWAAKIGALLAIPAISYFSMKIIQWKTERVVPAKRADAQAVFQEVKADYDRELLPTLLRRGSLALRHCAQAFSLTGQR